MKPHACFLRYCALIALRRFWIFTIGIKTPNCGANIGIGSNGFAGVITLAGIIAIAGVIIAYLTLRY